MRGRDWLKVVVCGMVSLSLCSGCSWFGKKKAKNAGTFGETEGITPGVVDVGSIPPPDRMADGNRVPVSEFNVENVLFSYDSYQIAESEIAKVEKVAEFLKSNADIRLVTEGHCDERGSNEYNMSLGEHRALAVRAYLVGLGVDSSRIQTRSFGEEKPLESGHNEAAWRANRRVEFALFR